MSSRAKARSAEVEGPPCLGGAGSQTCWSSMRSDALIFVIALSALACGESPEENTNRPRTLTLECGTGPCPSADVFFFVTCRDTLQLGATARDAAGRVVTLEESSVFESSNPRAVSVTQAGRLTVPAAGT